MAVELDLALDPDEPVVFRDPRRWLAAAYWKIVLIWLATMACIWPLELVDGKLSFGLTAFLITASVLVGVPLLCLQSYQTRTTEALVTDRRVLYRSRAYGLHDIPLDEIAAVDYPAPETFGTVRITRDRERNVELPDLGAPQTFARAVARAAGRPTPRLDGAMEHAFAYTAMLAALPCSAAAFFFGPRVQAAWPLEADMGFGLQLAFTSLQALPYMATLTLCLLLTFPLVMALLRPFVTAEEMAAALGPRPGERRSWRVTRWLRGPLAQVGRRPLRPADRRGRSGITLGNGHGRPTKGSDGDERR